MIHFKNQIIIVIAACLLAFISGSQQAWSLEDEPIGKVTAIRGKVVAIDKGSNSRPLFLKAPVFLKDTIKTRNGRIQMMFKDNTLITLGRNSDMQITRYLWEPGNTQSKMETRVEEGSFRILGGAITRVAPDNFKTDSPTGTIGVRGSMYAGRVENASLFVVFQGGTGIYVQNSAGMVNITRPGFGTQVKTLGQAPEEPKKVTPEQLQELESTLATAPLPLEESENVASADPDKADPAAAETTETDAADPAETEPQEPVAEADDSLDQAPLPEDAPVFAEVPSPEPISEITSIISETTVNSTQSSVNEALPLTGTEKTIEFLLYDLGFTDITLSASVPPSGIGFYKGLMQNTVYPNEAPEDMKFIVNWDNQRIIGFEDISSGPDSPGFGFGTIDSAGNISNMRILGSGGEPGTNEIITMTGSETFGHFYGSNAGGIGLAMEGYDYNVRDQTQSIFWSDIIAGKLETTTSNPYSGVASWQGFFVGVSENMADPNTNRRVFTNTSTSSFSLSINKNVGTFSGSLIGEDFNNAANDITALTIGGSSSDSAYLTDKTMAAAISGGAGAIDIGGSSGGLKTYGNYMVTSKDAMLSDYTTWGYWEIAYVDPATSENYHLHVPGSMWTAGERTTTTDVNSYISASFTGTYTGKARGVMLTPSSQMTELTNGTTNLTLNFASAASTSVSGNISFDEITLLVDSTTAISNTGFTADISGAAGSNGVNGAFYGPGISGGSGSGPAAIGGNFSADISGTQYHGIFGGNLQP